MAKPPPSVTDIEQVPAPGTAMVLFCGDCLSFFLKISPGVQGQAYVRTNLGTAGLARKEVINRVEKNEIKLGEAWYDLPMTPVDQGHFVIRLPLTQTGYFQAKCFFLPENAEAPVWPAGDNTAVSVEPAGTCSANIIYNAFVRQFGPNREKRTKDPALDNMVTTLDKKGYTVIPGSGKFRDLKAQVKFIFAELGCRALHLLPIHPTPTTYARMGRFGSPYAALDFSDVDPALAVFDPAATPLEQFMELADTVHAYRGYLILDIAINHTGWAASIHESHPEWLDRSDDGEIQAPGAWGVVWADLTRLDFSHTDLWQYMADVFLLWCHRGVDGFRCDAGYMIPVRAWEYIIAKVRQEYPDTLFFLEGLGGPLDTTKTLLGPANFNWAYSELFQQYTLEQISHYLPFSVHVSQTCGHLIHFAETHDNDRLARVSHTYARMRTALCALVSVSGGFGFANGVEWFATEKINVHDAASLNWGSPVNQVALLKRLVLILREHPAFGAHARLALIHTEGSGALVLLREPAAPGSRILVLVNLDCQQAAVAIWPAQQAGERDLADLISGGSFAVDTREDLCRLTLAPGQVLALSPAAADLARLEAAASLPRQTPARVLLQKRKAQALSLVEAVRGYGDLGDLDLEAAARAVAQDPAAFIRDLFGDARENRVIRFRADRDLNRRVMVPPHFFLMVEADRHFRAELLAERNGNVCLGYKESLPSEDGTLFRAVFLPKDPREADCRLRLRLFDPEQTRVVTGHVRYLPPFDDLSLSLAFNRFDIVRNLSLKQLSTTRKGGMMRAAASFGNLESRYDALLGANLNPDLPEDRWMLLARYRMWSVFQGYSRELSLDCLQTFWASYGQGGKWRFRVPTSEGRYSVLVAWLNLDRDRNRVTLTLHREPCPSDNPRRLQDERKVTVIVRPDIEDRSFHQTVKAYTGPETLWPARIRPFGTGFCFDSDRGVVLRVASTKDGFFPEPEWQYMVHRPLEATRGLDPDSDLFSPGYFKVDLAGGDTVCLDAESAPGLSGPPEPAGPRMPEPPPAFEMTLPFTEALNRSLDAFITDRGQEKSVIAGFPWFLDWGRDSLIFCRSLIELGRQEEALAILRLFGQFEHQGTLPNMICGQDARNIETSDAPLWFFACCRQLAEQEGREGVLDQIIGSRTLGRILSDMASAMVQGTPTGVRMDPETGLLYSPPHFTWMDTNFPAGTPRDGYPVEIQALWHHALAFLSRADQREKRAGWADRAAQVKQSILDRFWRPDLGYFSDCLHGRGRASDAMADDALRPNQLLLITLGAVTDPDKAEQALNACQELLVPGAIRSLSGRPVSYPLPVVHSGQTLNDPHAPYAGIYAGDEDTRRKPAYHNGTAWTWPFPLFCEAWVRVYGRSAVPAALAWLGSALPLMRNGAAGFVPEILDGDFPHLPRGCDAQAWGNSELARVACQLTRLLTPLEKGRS